MKIIRNILFICAFSSIAFQLNAQILKGILKESQRKIEREVGNMVVDKASEIIARKAMQSLESAFDKMVREAMESDSTYRNDGSVPDSVYYSAGQKYAEFLRGMNQAADLPPSYDFDISMLVESYHGKEKPKEMLMHFAQGKAIIGIEQMEGKDKTLMIVDMDKDVVVMYEEKQNGKKTVQALPNMMGLAGSMAKNNANNEDEPFTFKATGKTKMVAGYKTKEFKGSSKTEEMKIYFSEDVPIDWKSTYGAMIKKVAPTTFRSGTENMKGMALESYTMDKKKPKTEYFYTTKEVMKKPFKVDNSSYEMANSQ